MSTEIFSAVQIKILKSKFPQNLSANDFDEFLQTCIRTRLDPFARHIYATERKNTKSGKYTMSIQVSIDGFRSIAANTGEYEGQVGPEWCGKDGKWVDVWLKQEPPFAARVGVLRKGFKAPIMSVAKWESYVQLNYDKNPTNMWAQDPDLMIAKCAESLSLRKAFPQHLGGLYTNDEMAQATNADEAPKKGDNKIVADQPGPNDGKHNQNQNMFTFGGLKNHTWGTGKATPEAMIDFMDNYEDPNNHFWGKKAQRRPEHYEEIERAKFWLETVAQMEPAETEDDFPGERGVISVEEVKKLSNQNRIENDERYK